VGDGGSVHLQHQVWNPRSAEALLWTVHASAERLFPAATAFFSDIHASAVHAFHASQDKTPPLLPAKQPPRGEVPPAAPC